LSPVLISLLIVTSGIFVSGKLFSAITFSSVLIIVTGVFSLFCFGTIVVFVFSFGVAGVKLLGKFGAIWSCGCL
jgi:hypothetical protein